MKAQKKLRYIFIKVAFERSIAYKTVIKSFCIKVTSAVSIAISAPVQSQTDVAIFKAGASLIPSPTNATKSSFV